MIRFRHRRRLRAYRYLAVAAPAAAVVMTGAAYALQGRWWWVAAGSGAGLSLLLGSAILRLDRRWRVAYAAGRAAHAAAFAAEYERYTSEHRSFAAHMIELLDAASDRIGIQRMTLDLLEAQIAKLRGSRPPAAEQVQASKKPGQEVVLLGDIPAWNELWPDVSDAPTVVDLVAWDERSQSGGENIPADDIIEQSA
jgi:hypothetical protein